MYDCPNCDPELFVIYGICNMCRRRCQPPLLDPKDEKFNQSLEFFRSCWITEEYKRSEKK